MSRCDSAAIVPNTSELLPEPETPVNTVSRRFGISTLTSFRLLTRAPTTRIRSCPSGSAVACFVAGFFGATFFAVGLMRSAQLLNADEVAGGIAERAVAQPVRLLGRLLHH